MNITDRARAFVVELDRRARPWSEGGRWRGHAYEFLLFGLKQAWACLFGGLMLALLVGTFLFYPKDAALARYDFLVLAAVGIQAGLIALRLEGWKEAGVILVFHVVGTVMEVFKTHHGSWAYPEDGLLRIGTVPLFSGFMYACVGSYMARAIRLFDIQFTRYPPVWATWLLAVGAYLNFFTDAYGVDVRWGLFALAVVLFGRALFWFRPDVAFRKMPVLLGFMLVALFIWFAENLGTAAGAWLYPSQTDGWHIVPLAKMGSWFLLMMLSFVLVTVVHRPRISRARPQPDTDRFARNTIGSKAPGWRS